MAGIDKHPLIGYELWFDVNSRIMVPFVLRNTFLICESNLAHSAAILHRRINFSHLRTVSTYLFVVNKLGRDILVVPGGC